MTDYELYHRALALMDPLPMALGRATPRRRCAYCGFEAAAHQRRCEDGCGATLPVPARVTRGTADVHRPEMLAKVRV